MNLSVTEIQDAKFEDAVKRMAIADAAICETDTQDVWLQVKLQAEAEARRAKKDAMKLALFAESTRMMQDGKKMDMIELLPYYNSLDDNCSEKSFDADWANNVDKDSLSDKSYNPEDLHFEDDGVDEDQALDGFEKDA